MFFIILLIMLLIFPLYYIGIQMWAIKSSTKEYLSEKKAQKEKEIRDIQIRNDQKMLRDIFISANVVSLEKLLKPIEKILIETELGKEFDFDFSTAYILYNKDIVELFYSFIDVPDENLSYNSYNYHNNNLLVMEYHIKNEEFLIHNEYEFLSYFKRKVNLKFPNISSRYDYLKKIITSKTIQNLVSNYDIMKQNKVIKPSRNFPISELIDINYYFKNNELTYLVFSKDSNEKDLLNDFILMLIEVSKSNSRSEISKNYITYSKLKIERKLNFNAPGYHVFIDVENLKLMFYNNESYNNELGRYYQSLSSKKKIYYRSGQAYQIDLYLENGFINIVDIVKELKLYLSQKDSEFKDHLVLRIFYNDFHVYSLFNTEKSNFNERIQLIETLASEYL